jgi:D-alanyl-D-alanine carboxypeptidase (penicillin-binding protein 5/6)
VLALAFAGSLVGVGLLGSGQLGGGERPPGSEEPVAGTGSIALAEAGGSADGREERAGGRQAARFALQPEPVRTPVRHEFGDPPRAGLLFDVESGEILWERHIDREAPIASLTKMMTAYLIARRHRPDEKVEISRDAVRTGGSMIGVLQEGTKVPLGALLKGLLLVSGNDAATALAEHDAGSVERFVARMNAAARRLGLRCTRFTTPHGLGDAGNHSCPRDLAVLARADLANARIAAIARTDHDRVDIPLAGGGTLELYNNNPFIRAGDRTITGLKTGYTDAAGRCYVTTAERGGRELGVVLLDSPDPYRQVPKLLELGAAAG